ncbi:transmembrane protein 154 isoform X2 [Triplophysa dalaica]|uniref:transmembrane protein 154 isoform X2 n=1 Tax=Triplophysa dalaica TaxID=1582913 RepID=UPI0024DF7F62|nr:transmembrane protein 154 isoform X2 [Triplophysa dalaica]
MTLVLLLFLALTASWTGPVLCEDEGMGETENVSEGFISEVSTQTNAEDPENHENAGSGEGTTQGAYKEDQDSTASPEITVNSERNLTDEKGTDTDSLQKVIIISLVLTLIIIPVIVCGVVIYCRRRTKVVGDNLLAGPDCETNSGRDIPHSSRP